MKKIAGAIFWLSALVIWIWALLFGADEYRWVGQVAAGCCALYALIDFCLSVKQL